jgi:hypothetical protein
MAKPFKVIDAPLDRVEDELNAAADDYLLHLFIPGERNGQDRVLLVLVKKPPAQAMPIAGAPRIFGARGN